MVIKHSTSTQQSCKLKRVRMRIRFDWQWEICSYLTNRFVWVRVCVCWCLKKMLSWTVTVTVTVAVGRPRPRYEAEQNYSITVKHTAWMQALNSNGIGVAKSMGRGYYVQLALQKPCCKLNWSTDVVEIWAVCDSSLLTLLTSCGIAYACSREQS